jgi:hypothetical protein
MYTRRGDSILLLRIQFVEGNTNRILWLLGLMHGLETLATVNDDRYGWFLWTAMEGAHISKLKDSVGTLPSTFRTTCCRCIS